VTAKWTDSSSNVHIGYLATTTDSIGNGSVTVDLKATPSALITITDGTDGNKPAGGASVTVYNEDGVQVSTVTTDALGKVLVPDLTAGDKYYAFAAKSSMKTRYVQFTATTDTATNVAAVLQATVSLTVAAKDGSGASIPGVDITVSVNGLGSIQLGSGSTDSTAGAITFSDLPAGEQVDVKASKSGYSDGQTNQVSLSNATNTVDVTLAADTTPTSYDVSPTVTLDAAGDSPDSATEFTLTIGSKTLKGTFNGTGTFTQTPSTVSLPAGTYSADDATPSVTVAVGTGSAKISGSFTVKDDPAGEVTGTLTIKYTAP
jgi:hypothetical protein